MRIHYFIHITGTDSGISGIPRVVKNLGRQLVVSEGIELIPVCWDVAEQAVVHASHKHLKNFARHGGPELQESEAAGQPIRFQRGDWLLFAEAPHLHSYDPEYPSISIIDPIGYARRFGARTAAILHDILPLSHRGSAKEGRAFLDIVANGGGDDGELDRLRFTVYAQAMVNVDVVLPVSRTSGTILADWLLAHGHAAERLPPIRPVPLPEEIAGIARVPGKRVERGPGSNPIEFLTVGTVCAHKNQLSAMMAFSRLIARRPELDLRFLVVGTVTPDCAAPASLIAKRSGGRIQLHGHVPDHVLGQMWRRAHASVFVSLAEGYGLPVAESLWYGRPCLCSNDGSIAEIARTGGCLLVDPRNLDEIEAGFETLVTDTGRYDDLLQQLNARQMRSWKTYADEVAEQLGAERRPAPPEAMPAAKPSLIPSRRPEGHPADQTVEATLSISASDLDVLEAYLSGHSKPIRRNGAICYERATYAGVAERVLFFGPYISLPPGRYEFALDGEIEGELELTFTADEGRQELARTKVTGFDKPVAIELKQATEKFEMVGFRTPRLERLIFRNAFAKYADLAVTQPAAELMAPTTLAGGADRPACPESPAPPAPGAVGLESGSRDETAIDVGPADLAPTMLVGGDDQPASPESSVWTALGAGEADSVSREETTIDAGPADLELAAPILAASPASSALAAARGAGKKKFRSAKGSR